MILTIDARVPVVLGNEVDAGPRDAVLHEGPGVAGHGQDWFQPIAEGAHPPGCGCCPPRNSAGMALARLMLARGRGTGLFFTRVIAVTRTDAGKAEIAAALTTDPLASSFYRLATEALATEAWRPKSDD